MGRAVECPAQAQCRAQSMGCVCRGGTPEQNSLERSLEHISPISRAGAETPRAACVPGSRPAPMARRGRGGRLIWQRLLRLGGGVPSFGGGGGEGASVAMIAVARAMVDVGLWLRWCAYALPPHCCEQVPDPHCDLVACSMRDARACARAYARRAHLVGRRGRRIRSTRLALLACGRLLACRLTRRRLR